MKAILTLLACTFVAALAPLLAASPRFVARRSASPQKESVNANQLVHDVVWNEIHAQLHDETEWEYRETRNEGGDTQLMEVVETKYGDIHRLLAVNGNALTPRQEDAETRRIEKLVNDPGQIRDNEKKSHEDAEQERNLMTLLPNAFIFRYEGRTGDTIKLAFAPDPAFRATSHESEVFHHMEGHLLVYAPEKRLEEIDGLLTSPVKFWGGVLGHLDKGGTFVVEQHNVGSGHWEMTRLNVEMNGKALFFKTIAVRQKESYTDFKRVPDDITLKQAAERIKAEGAG